jgi:hypothetical protein
MFGGNFGAFRSRNRHCFDEDQNPIPGELAKIAKVRQQEVALRRGRQYLRQISGDGIGFGFPRIMAGRMRSIVAWSRILDQQEVLAAVNTDPDSPTTAWVTIDNDLHSAGSNLRCLYSTDDAQIGTTVLVAARNGKAVNLAVPSGGFVIYN